MYYNIGLLSLPWTLPIKSYKKSGEVFKGQWPNQVTK